MSCKHPLKGFPIGLTASGKTQYKISSYNTNHVEYDGQSWINVPYEHLSPRTLKVVRDYIDIPCGQCFECRMQYSRQWADRCMLELKQHSESWFITLTYDNDHLTFNDTIDDETGEIYESSMPTLIKKDMQDFMKRLRISYERLCEKKGIEANHIKYFLCGEYSPRLRPHYHLIVFGLHLDDLKAEEKTPLGDILYSSDFVASLWKDKDGNPIGRIRIGEVTWESCAYVARYILKKQKGDGAKRYKYFNFEPEFILMSRKPAIGLEYYEKHKNEIFNQDEVFVSTKNGSISIKPPRYYEKKFELDYPEDYEKYKENKKLIGECYNQLKMERTSLPYLKQLQIEENDIINKCKIFNKRGDIDG